MAKYTILYKTLKETGFTLPVSFTNLAALFGDLNFEQAFETRNLLKEIGQETAEAFFNRVDAKALALFPRVKKQLAAIKNAPTGRNRSEKTTQNLTSSGQSQVNKGDVQQTTNNYAHPISVEELNNTETISGTSARTTSGADTQSYSANNGGTVLREYTEETVDTALTYAELLERYGDVFNETLKAFDVLFLGVW